MEEIITNNPLKEDPEDPKKKKLIPLLSFLILIQFLFIIFFLVKNFSFKLPEFRPPGINPPKENLVMSKFDKFKSVEEFKEYLKESETVGAGLGAISGFGMTKTMQQDLGNVSEFMPSARGGAGRVSETNVQVIGIDEPDIVKTDGKQIYFSLFPYFYRPIELTPEKSYIPPQPPGAVNIIKAFPPQNLAKIGKIEKTGNLLVFNKILIVFDDKGVWGYDVSDPALPKEKWQLTLKDNVSVFQSRLHDGKLYIVTKTNVNRSYPCPIEPFSLGGKTISIACSDIYYPRPYVSVDTTYTATVIDPENGQAQNFLSFLGSSNSQVMYMSQEAIYVAYTFSTDYVQLMYEFFTKDGKNLISQELLTRIEKLLGYEISSSAKMMELGNIINDYWSTLSNDERLRVENEMENRMKTFLEQKKRTLEKTGIVKIGLSNFSVDAKGEIPGRSLNQFSLDEYKNYLRIATTVGGTTFNTQGSANDIYVLDKNLKIVGQIIDLGVDERIYSARFIEDKGYLVTFKQVDPFFVLDLKDPSSPKLKGQLKIPGYSSYLHPLYQDRILGIGKEGNELKISLFNVSSPDNPFEESKYILNDYTSDILETHHAFLQDAKHQVFFIPGGEGGYIFSYQNNNLSLIRAVSGILAKRAVYLDDYLYILGDQKLVVLNENTWEQVNEIDF